MATEQMTDRFWPDIVRARAAGPHADDEYLVEVGGRRLSWQATLAEAEIWAARFSAHGVGVGDRVLSMQTTTARSVTTWLAVALLGAVEVPIGVSLVGALLEHVVRDADPKLVVTEARFLPVLTPIVDDLGVARLVVDADSLGPVPDVVVEPVPLRAEDLAVIIYTSGTTGASKGVMTGWGHLQESARNSPLDLESPRFYCPFPMNHVSAKVPLYWTAEQGGTVVLRAGFSLGDFWADVQEHSCNCTLLMGTMATLLMLQPARAGDAANPLRQLLMAPLIPELEDFTRRFDVDVSTVFNMTELASPIQTACGKITDWRSCGRVGDGWHVRIVDEHDEEVPPGATGELIVRHDRPWRMMLGYWRQPEKTLEAFRNQWFHTGDSFSRDEDGNYFFRDRMKDTIRRRGENISSTELEEEVRRHPAVAEVAAVGVPSELGEEDVKIVVVRERGMTLEAEELCDYLVPRLPRYMVPRYIEFVSELPRTPTQKVEKRLLREAAVNESTWERPATR